MKTRTLLLLWLLVGQPAAAHEGKIHIMGTIARVDAEQVVVTDREGKQVSISLTKETKYEQGGAATTVNALKPGIRVVIDVRGSAGDFTATQVRVPPVELGGHQQPAGE